MQIETSTIPAPVQPPPVMQRMHTLKLTDAELLWVTASIGGAQFRYVHEWYTRSEAKRSPLACSHVVYEQLLKVCRDAKLLKMNAIATAITFQCELDKLAALKPPRQVLEAAKQASHAIVAGLTPPKDLVQYVTRWMQRQQQQDRYGK